jgi:hypothetical protein
VGSSCRNLLRCLCVGLEQIVFVTRADPQVTDFHLRGFAPCRPVVNKYVCVAAVASYAVESCLLETMADDRLLRRLSEIKEALKDELIYIEELSSFVWDRPGTVATEYSTSGLQSHTLLAANTSVAFTTRKVLTVPEDLPWSLTQWDVAANLEALYLTDKTITDSTAVEIKTLLNTG